MPLIPAWSPISGNRPLVRQMSIRFPRFHVRFNTIALNNKRGLGRLMTSNVLCNDRAQQRRRKIKLFSMDKICSLKRKRIYTSSSSFVVTSTRPPVSESCTSSFYQENEELIHEVSQEVADEIRRMEDEIEELELSKQSEQDEEWEFSPCPKILEPFPHAAKDEEMKRSGMKRARMEQYAQVLALIRPKYRAYLVERRTRTDLPEKPPKKGRGCAQPITKRPANGQRVRLLWNGDNCPVGSWGDNFNNYLGILARRADLWNIYYDWPSQP